MEQFCPDEIDLKERIAGLKRDLALERNINGQFCEDIISWAERLTLAEREVGRLTEFMAATRKCCMSPCEFHRLIEKQALAASEPPEAAALEAMDDEWAETIRRNPRQPASERDEEEEVGRLRGALGDIEGLCEHGSEIFNIISNALAASERNEGKGEGGDGD